MDYNTSKKTIKMIKSVKWLIGFILWTLLYYVLNYFVFKNIFNDTIMQLENINKFVLILSMIISFATSFSGKLFNIKNIMFHLSVPLTIGISKVLEITINSTIYIVNKFSYLVSAPTLGYTDLRFGLIQTGNCENTISGLTFAYLFTLAIIIIVSISGYYGDLIDKKYNRVYCDELSGCYDD